MIIVEWQGQQWDDKTAPWEDHEQTFKGHPLHALELMGAIVHYENTRPVSWQASTADEAAYISEALARRPYMSGFVQRDWQGAVSGESR